MVARLVTQVPAPAGDTLTGARGDVTAAAMLTVVVRDTRSGTFNARQRHKGCGGPKAMM